MFGKIALMELRTGWKGVVIFSLLVIIVSYGMPLIFPTYRDSLTEELEGESNVKLELPDEQGGEITLSWQPQDVIASYIVLEDNRSSLVTAKIRYMGEATSITFEQDFEEKRYYAVLGLINETSDRVLVGITATEKEGDPFQELLENPAYSGFTGGRNFSILEVKGFISVEFFSWWWMLAGLYIAYLSVAVVGSDFEIKHLDILLSRPISRRRYILEKFIAMSIISLFIIIVATIGLVGGLASINALSDFSTATAFISLVGFFPFILVIAAVGILSAILFQKMKAATGLTIAFVFAEFFLYTFGSFSKSLEWMKTISIFSYWDYNSIIIDNFFKIYDFIFLTGLASLLIIISTWIFNKKDIPV